VSSTHGGPTHSNELPLGSSPAIATIARFARSIPCVARRVATGLTIAALVGAAGCGGGGSRSSSATVTHRADAVKPALDALRSAMEAGDPDPVLATFADDVQLHSPALIGPEYRGRDVVASIVTPAMQVLEDVQVTDHLESADGASGGVVFDARVGGQPAQGVVLLRSKGERVGEITLLLRPLPALRAFVTRMGELGAQPALDARRG
jgi:hypothetical protein